MYPQRCRRTKPHAAHRVPPRGTRTGFDCPGPLSAAELERLLDEAFGGVMSRGPN
jgi:hypothetical protein